MEQKNIRNSVLTRWLGFEDCYDKYRPSPPAELLDLLSEVAGGGRVKLVVDLGAGTGLSTRVWASRAETVIGIEPSRSMFATAVSKPSAPNVEYRNAFAEQTGLPDASVDIVTASSSLHWLHPQRATTEVARILRAGGVFCAFGVRNPLPLRAIALEQDIFQFRRECAALAEKHETEVKGQRWKWADYKAALADSKQFSDVREVWLHSSSDWSVQDLAGWLRSHADLSKLKAQGLNDDQTGLETLCGEVVSHLGSGKSPWLFQWKLLLGIRPSTSE